MKLSSFFRKENYTVRKLTDKALVFFFEKKGKWEGFFYTMSRKPRSADMVRRNSVIVKPDEKIAIVMQGPIMTKDNFTFETLKLYKKMYNGIDIILSTWENEDPVAIKRIMDLGVIVIKNKKPAFAGPYNVNLQIESSKNGLLEAKRRGAEFAVKVRSDQRMYNPDSINLFLMLHYQYPPDQNSKQKGRLFSINIGVMKYRLYCVGDMMFFGQIDEMLIYWGCKYDMRNLVIPPNLTTLEVSRLMIAETHLTISYLEKIGHNPLWTAEDSWSVYGKYFCIIDHPLFDLYWNKYSSYTEYKSRFYTMNHNYESLTYADWLAAYMGKPLNLEQLREFYNIREGGSLENPKDFIAQE